jgi:hypothetical protein
MPRNLVDEQGRPHARQPSLIDWASCILEESGQTLALHHRLLLEQLEAVAVGSIDRLMVPAWWFTRHPVSSVIATSHTASLAESFGRQVRDMVKERGSQLGYTLHAGLRAAGHWRTSAKGEYFASGVRGPLTGRRADLAIIDDPIKSHAEADSPVLRDWIWNWYRSDLTPRLKPNGRVVLVMTRWHEDDLAGRLLALNAAEWQVICLLALAQDNDPLGRAPGAALWPEWEDEAALLRKRDSVGERTWQALYQQSPRPIQGSLFMIGCIDVLDAAPKVLAGPVVRAWDLAALSPPAATIRTGPSA